MDVVGWMLGIGMAWAAGPIEVPLMVPAHPTAPLATQPTATIGWTLGKAGPARADLQPGRTLVQRPFLRVDDKAVCRCNSWRVVCALLEDGSIVFDLAASETPPKGPSLAQCTLDGRTFDVVGTAPALPGPWEDSPDHWNVAVWWGGGEAAQVPLLWLPNPKAWNVSDAADCIIVGTGKDAVLTWTGAARSDAFTPCATERGGRQVWVRPVPFRMPWATSPDAATPPADAP